jgi:hypothetical protein
MLGSEPSRLLQKLSGAATLAVILFLGILAYWVSPVPELAGKGLLLCGGALLGAIVVGWAIARIFRGSTPAPIVDGVAFWVGALVTFPAFRYIHDSTDWALHPGAGEYSFAQHSLAMLVPTLLYVLGQIARRR